MGHVGAVMRRSRSPDDACRLQLSLFRPIAQLVVRVRAPADDLVSLRERAAVGAAETEGRDVVERTHLRRPLVGRARAEAELSFVVRAPTLHRAVVENGARRGFTRG